GWERAALAAVVWGTYFPGRLWWTGGSFLRWDWLAALFGGLALARRDKPFAAGALLAYAALSRVFPVFALVGAVLAALAAVVRRQKVDRTIARLLAGAALATALLVPIAGAVRSGAGWSEFTRNLAKHTSVPSTNRMGLAVVVAFDSAATHRALDRQGGDTRGRWPATTTRSSPRCRSPASGARTSPASPWRWRSRPGSSLACRASASTSSTRRSRCSSCSRSDSWRARSSGACGPRKPSFRRDRRSARCRHSPSR